MNQVLLTLLKLVDVEYDKSCCEVLCHITCGFLLGLLVLCLWQFNLRVSASSLESDFPTLIRDSNFGVALLDGHVELVNDIEWLSFDFKTKAWGQNGLLWNFFELVFVEPLVIKANFVVTSPGSSTCSIWYLVSLNLPLHSSVEVSLTLGLELLFCGNFSSHPWVAKYFSQRSSSRHFLHS